MKKYLVIGNPIEHSLSPKLHNYWFEKNNIDANYDRKKIDKSEIQKIISEIREDKLDGINVTVPLKKNVIPFLDKLSRFIKLRNLLILYINKIKLLVITQI